MQQRLWRAAAAGGARARHEGRGTGDPGLTHQSLKVLRTDPYSLTLYSFRNSVEPLESTAFSGMRQSVVVTGCGCTHKSPLGCDTRHDDTAIESVQESVIWQRDGDRWRQSWRLFGVVLRPYM